MWKLSHCQHGTRIWPELHHAALTSIVCPWVRKWILSVLMITRTKSTMNVLSMKWTDVYRSCQIIYYLQFYCVLVIFTTDKNFHEFKMIFHNSGFKTSTATVTLYQKQLGLRATCNEPTLSWTCPSDLTFHVTKQHCTSTLQNPIILWSSAWMEPALVPLQVSLGDC